MSEKRWKIEVVQGTEGAAMYINDYRVAGPKPWGGGTVAYKWAVSDSDFLGAGLTDRRAPQGEPVAERTLRDDIRSALNYHSAENASGTPDFILANFLIDCLDAWNGAMEARTFHFAAPPADTDGDWTWDDAEAEIKEMERKADCRPPRGHTGEGT